LCQKFDRKKSGIIGFFTFKNHTKVDARDMPCKLYKDFNPRNQNGIIYAQMLKIKLKGLNYE